MATKGSGTKGSTPEERASRIPGAGSTAAASADARSEIKTHDDGSFVRTAVVLRQDEKTGSIDLLDDQGAFVARLNLFWTQRDGGNLIMDVIDVDDRFGKKRALTFSQKERREIDVPPGGRLVSVDFAKQ